MPTNGLFSANAAACAALKPTSSAFGKPGPCVAATASNCPTEIPAVRNADCATGIRFRRCSRAASSGTTPPYSAWSLICEETMPDKTLPSRTTATLVSSQEVSMASSVILFHGDFFRLGKLAVKQHAFKQILGAVELEVAGFLRARAILFIE